MKTLKDLEIGQVATIKNLRSGDPEYRQRLIMLGLLPGTDIKIVRVAPLGDPMQVCVRSSMILMRRDDAQMVELES